MDPFEGTGHLTSEALFRQYAGVVARILSRLGVRSDHLEDAVQEVFLTVHRNGGYRPGPAKPTTYLAQLAMYAAAKYRRREAIGRTRYSEHPVELVAGESRDLVHELEVRRDLKRLQGALDELPEDLRTTLLLVEAGQSCVSVAAILSCPVGTVYSRLHNARKLLQAALRSNRDRRRGHATAWEERAPRARSWSLLSLFGLRDYAGSEAARLLQLAREQPSAPLPVERLLDEHRSLLQSGAQPAAWVSDGMLRASSWVSLIGGPITWGLGAGGLVLAAWLLASGAHTRPSAQALATNVVAEPPAALPAGAHNETARVSALTAVLEAPVASKRARARRPARARTSSSDAARVEQREESAEIVGRAQAAPTIETETHTSIEGPARPTEPHPKQPSRRSTPPPNDPDLEEIRGITEAERMLVTDPARSLALTRAMLARFPDGHLREERAYLELMALHRLGRTSELRGKAVAFLRAYPAGIYSGRVRVVLGGAQT